MDEFTYTVKVRAIHTDGKPVSKDDLQSNIQEELEDSLTSLSITILDGKNNESDYDLEIEVTIPEFESV